MGTYIDRNPEAMKKYAKAAKKNAGDMVLIVRKLEGVLDAYAKDLDDRTRKRIAELHTCCNDFMKHSDVYYTLADDIEKKAEHILKALAP